MPTPESKTEQSEEEIWTDKYPLEGTPFTLLWQRGTSGFTPDLKQIIIEDFRPEFPVRMTVRYEGGSYLDICTPLQTVVDASANRFIEGGGDCALVEQGHPEPLLQMSKVVTQERTDARKWHATLERLNKWIEEKLVQREFWDARLRQMWESGECGGVYPPDAMEVLYGKRP